MQTNRIKLCISFFSAGLFLWLIWGFWSFGQEISLFLTVFILVITLSLSIWYFRQQKNSIAKKSSLSGLLPPESYQEAVIIVCGQSQVLFQQENQYRETAKGWYICAESPTSLLNIIQQIVENAPSQLCRLSLLYSLFPEQLTQLDDFNRDILNWRKAIHHCHKKVGKNLPFWISLYLNSPINNPKTTLNSAEETTWLTYLSHQQELQVISNSLTDQPLSIWLAKYVHHQDNQLAITLWLDQLLLWINESVIPQFTITQTGTSALIPIAWALQFTSVPSIPNNCWAQFIQNKTTLIPVIYQPENFAELNQALPLPDVLINKLSHQVNLLQIETLFGISGILCGIFLIGALLGSYHHNKQLIYDIGNDITLFKHISSENLEPKKVAYQQLLSDATSLSLWQREGIPARYSLALYQGNRILPYLHAVLSSWAPPQPPAPIIVQEAPEMVTLDSLALFASGQYELKTDATKVLVDALINIKAKPGWLIVISGYTDNTGNTELNQKLSLKRAESVRDWMIKTSDIAPSCFAVRGYGQYQPVADNSTLDGRARNRRVEIRLIPQADACQVLADDLTPLMDGGN
ncbi:OmpA family protein [Proteus hauseri]|uniref:OmpA family protein n=1 Tax=Proteus hauseri TaxID=183417 RepID=UPI0032D9D54E